ncbi:MAG: D-alanyl-D-alanine carboxypeptidase [Oscillatoriales cyanobacterium C42_A2020_001]|nr:D-alanyl-D-alanine carboxypeptidase [Leptolyngbyaceae cyanobacterium C42_A2020_001]
MLDFVTSGLVSVWLSTAKTPETLASTVTTLQATPWLVDTGDSDITTQSIMRQYLKGLESKGLESKGQGIWLQTGPAVLSTHQGTTPLPAASLTKVATTLVSLDTWGTDHRFETLVSTTGQIQQGVLLGDLIIQGGGDPLFVWEEAFALANTLTRMGIRKVTGNLVIVGNFQMNFEVDANKSGELLKQAFNSELWEDDAAYQYSQLPPGATAKPNLQIAGSVQVLSATNAVPTATLLVRHYSLPMVQILKQMNVHSNNVISETLAAMAGGAQIVAQKAAALSGVPQDEVLLANGSGLGVENRLSPRAVCAMYAALQRYLEPKNLTIADLFPISGTDLGTIDYRDIPSNAVVKTGTLNDVSALAGVLPTRDRGLIWFTIINRGADLDDLRQQQDVLLQQLTKQWGAVQPAPTAIAPRIPNQPVALLGASDRNVILYKPAVEVRSTQ